MFIWEGRFWIATSDEDINLHIGSGTGVARSLTNIWKAKYIGIRTKARLYKALVLSVLLCNSETWTLRETLNHKLRVFEMTVLRCIRGVTRRDRRRNENVWKELGVTRDIVNEIRHRRLSYYDHVSRMMPSRMPRIMLHHACHASCFMVVRIGQGHEDVPRRDSWMPSGTIAGLLASQNERRSMWRGIEGCGVVLSIGCWSAQTGLPCRCRRRNN